MMLSEKLREYAERGDVLVTDGLVAAVKALEERTEKAETGVAAMRAALDNIAGRLVAVPAMAPEKALGEILDVIEDALATDAGRDLAPGPRTWRLERSGIEWTTDAPSGYRAVLKSRTSKRLVLRAALDAARAEVEQLETPASGGSGWECGHCGCDPVPHPSHSYYEGPSRCGDCGWPGGIQCDSEDGAHWETSDDPDDKDVMCGRHDCAECVLRRVAEERAACADIADQHASIEGIAQRIAAAIRARGVAAPGPGGAR